MPLTATLTGVVGPDRAITAGVFSDVSDFTIHSNTNVLELLRGGLTTFVNVAAATTVTATKAGNVWTVTVS